MEVSGKEDKEDYTTSVVQCMTHFAIFCSRIVSVRALYAQIRFVCLSLNGSMEEIYFE